MVDCAILKDIIIPVASAIIGGFITMLGVVISVKEARKKEEKKRVEAAKPWIYSLDEHDKAKYSASNTIYLFEEGDPVSKEGCERAVIIIKNPSNSIGLVKEIQTECVKYVPKIGKILDQNAVTFLYVYLKNGKETLKDMRLLVTDIYDNPYEYEITMCDESKVWQINERTGKKASRKKRSVNKKQNK